MRGRLWLVLALVAALVAGAAFAGCGGDDDDDATPETTESTEATTADLELNTEGELLVGSDIPFPPFEFGDPPDYEGFDIDLVNEVADRLGLELTIQRTAFDTIFRDLAQGRFDMVASATTITPERERTVDFSDPYYEAEQALLVGEGSEIATVEDLDGRIVGAQDGTTGEAWVNDETEASEVRGFPGAAGAINALRAGQVDAVVIDQPVAQDATEAGAGEGLVVATTIPTDELYGLVFAEESQALREAVNEALAEIKEDGTLNDLYQEWFGIDAPDSVIEGTHDPS